MVIGRRWLRHGIPTRAGRPATAAAPARLDCRATWRSTRPHGRLTERRISPAATASRRARPRKRILFINQYYWPDHASTAQHLTDLAEFLAAAGLRVPCAHLAGPLQAGRARPPTYEIHEGVHIHRVPATSLGRRGTWARMTDYLSFYAGAIFKALRLPQLRRGRHPDHAARSSAWSARSSSDCAARGTFTGAWTSIPTPAWRSAGCRHRSRLWPLDATR